MTSAVPGIADIDGLMKVLRVDNLDHPLQTIVFCDDAAHIFNSNNKIMTRRLADARHNKCCYFICLQTWKMIAPEVKSMTNLVYLSGGFNQRDLRYIYSQLPIQITFEDFNELYQKMKNKYEKHRIDCVENSIDIVNRQNNSVQISDADNDG